MIANLLMGLALANTGLIWSMNIIVNGFQSKLHLLWLVPMFIFGALLIGSSLRVSIM